MNEHTATAKTSHSKLFLLALGALGVVFGDIGTSPLYAVKEIFFGKAFLNNFSTLDVLGGISMVFWALTLVVSINYIFIVLRADSEGEGGVFALYNLITSLPKPVAFLPLLLIFAAGLLYGDGMITPAISVISAVEGLNIITTSLKPFVIPITIAILTGLFMIQSQGTHKVGKIFGPVMVVWFSAIGIFGLLNIIAKPDILAAINPYYAFNFLTHHPLSTIFLTMGSVMLVITGGEAMYADMGHFGKLPIRLSWFTVAFPALTLNYLGQGAYLLSGKTVTDGNIFFSMIPPALLVPMVILATLATIIASQALISGVFSLTMQAISLRLLPYIKVTHTHEEHAGQVYIGAVNWALYIGTVILVLTFKSSSNLAGAYGLAVSGDMFINTLGMIVIATQLWKWNKLLAFTVFLPFVLIDSTFLLANSLKIFEGGFVPLSIAFTMFGIILIWKWGRNHTQTSFNSTQTMTIAKLIEIQRSTPNDLPRTMVFMTRTPIGNLMDQVPIQMERFWQHNDKLPEHLVFLNIVLLKSPHAKQRVLVNHFTKPNEKTGTVTSLTVQFGFMEDPNIEPLVQEFIKNKEIPSNHPADKWIFHIIHERPQQPKDANFWTKIKFGIYKFIQRNTDNADDYFGLGQQHDLTIDVFPVVLK